MDDLTKIMLTAAGTLAVAVVGALVGAWLQSRRERDKWLREQRLEAYAVFFDKAMDLHRRIGHIELSIDDWNTLFDTLSRVHLLGDRRALIAAYAVRDALDAAKDDAGRTPRTERAGVALDDFSIAARKALGVRI